MKPGDADATAPMSTEAVTASAVRQIGPYSLLHRLGEGGMGEVWLAEQQQPVRRQVAIKVIKAGMDTRNVILRFEAERQALALMDHPGIATVFDGGTTPEGRPYFAMEFVKGERITAYCDRNRLTTDDRLRLFAEVCDAVQHAHQKGVIHRDLKPSNILVTLRDDRPVPKIIDFGVAKAIAQSLTERPFFTEVGALVGTPEYMSPEQAEMSGLDLDTRTDVYALGVVLYELLTGALPFDRSQLRSAGIDEIRRVIREEDPQKPSTRVTRLGTASTTSARNRQTEPGRLASQLRGDLDWIIMRALEKDRRRRYATANAFGADIRRHLDNEPVAAGPPGAMYRARKFTRRHRVGVGAAAALSIILIAAATALAVQVRRTAAQRDIAARERDRAERVSAFLVSLFQASAPDRSKGETITALDLLERGRQRLEAELKDQPQSRATLLHSIGDVYETLGRHDVAKPLLEEALAIRRSATGRDRADLADTLNTLANVMRMRGDLRAAESLHREALEIRREVFGPVHVKVAQSTANMAIYEWYRARYAEAEALDREAAAIAEKAGAPGDAASMLVAAADNLTRENRLLDAIEVMQRALPVLEREYGIEHTRTQYAMNSLAFSLYLAERNEEAEPLQRRILAVRRKMLGENHFDVAMALYNLGNTLGAEGRLEEAEPLLQQSIDMFRKVASPEDRQVAWAMAGHADVVKKRGRLDEAEREYRAALDVFARSPNTPPGESSETLNGLADLYYLRHQYDAAAATLRTSLAQERAEKIPIRAVVAGTERSLARVLCERGPSDEALPLIRDAIEFDKTAAPHRQWNSAFSEAVLARCLSGAGDFAGAEPLATAAHAQLARRGNRGDETRYTAWVLAELYQAWGKPDKAAEWRTKRN